MKNRLLFYIMLVCTIYVCTTYFASAGLNEGVQTTVGIGTTNLWTYWSFDSTTTADYGSYLYTPNRSNIQMNASGYLGGCVQFNGTTTILAYPNASFPTSKPYTIAWLGKARDSLNTGYWWGESAGSNAYNLARLQAGQGFDGQFIQGGGVLTWPVMNPAQNFSGLATTTWLFYAETVNSSGSPQTYVNGSTYGAPTNNAGNQTTFTGLTYNFTLGNRLDLARSLNGSIDELMTFNAALSTTQLAKLQSDLWNYGIRPYTNISTVTGLNVTIIGNDSLTIVWHNDTSSAFNHTKIFYNTTTNGTLIFVSQQSTETKNITGLTPNTTYSIYVFSYAKNNMNTTTAAYTTNTTYANNASTPTIVIMGNATFWNASFDSGSIDNITLDANWTWNMTFKLDTTGCDYDQCTTWFYVNSSNMTAGQNFTLRFTNYYDTGSGYWLGANALPYQLCNYADYNNWTRQGTRRNYSIVAGYQVLELNLTAQCNNPQIAAWIPYPVNRTQALVNELNGTAL